MTARERGPWVVTVRPDPIRVGSFKVTATDGVRVIHRDRLDEAQAESFDPEADWRSGLATTSKLRRST